MIALGRILYRWLPWALPVGLGALGWRWGGWLGVAAGVAVGLLLAVAAWLGIYYLAFTHQLGRRQAAVSKLSMQALKEMVDDPTSPHLGFAMGELERRGNHARPSVESLCSLLLAVDSNRRALGMNRFHALYPKLWAQVVRGERWSNLDPPEVWQERVLRIRAGG